MATHLLPSRQIRNLEHIVELLIADFGRVVIERGRCKVFLLDLGVLGAAVCL